MLQKQEAKKENLGKKKTIVNVVKKTLECVCVFGETALMEEEGTVEDPTRMTRTVTCIADSSVVELLSLSRINFFNVCGLLDDLGDTMLKEMRETAVKTYDWKTEK